MWALVLLRLILLARWSAVTAATRLRAMAAVPVAAFVMSALSQYLGAAVAVRLFDRLDVLGVAWIRIVVAAVVLAAWRRPWRRSWRRGDLARVVPYGLALVGMNLAFYLAIDRIPLGTAVAIEFAGPIAVTVLGDRRARNLGAAALAAVGVVLLADVEWAGNAAGVCYALGAATLWALYIVFGRRSTN